MGKFFGWLDTDILEYVRISFAILVVIACFVLSVGDEIFHWNISTAPMSGAALFAATGFIVSTVLSLLRIERHTKSLASQSKMNAKIDDELAHIRTDISLIRSNYDRHSLMAVEAPKQDVWRGFTGLYTAFNPSFESDVDIHGEVNDDRAEMHRSRYGKKGVSTSRYYLYSGDADNDEVELGVKARFICLVNEAAKTSEKNPEENDIKKKIKVGLIPGRRPETSFFYGDHGRPEAVGQRGIMYVTNDTLKVFSDGLEPLLIFYTNDKKIIDTSFAEKLRAILKNPLIVQEDFPVFEAEVLAELAKRRPEIETEDRYSSIRGAVHSALFTKPHDLRFP